MLPGWVLPEWAFRQFFRSDQTTRQRAWVSHASFPSKLWTDCAASARYCGTRRWLYCWFRALMRGSVGAMVVCFGQHFPRRGRPKYWEIWTYCLEWPHWTQGAAACRCSSLLPKWTRVLDSLVCNTIQNRLLALLTGSWQHQNLHVAPDLSRVRSSSTATQRKPNSGPHLDLRMLLWCGLLWPWRRQCVFHSIVQRYCTESFSIRSTN